MQGVCPGVVPGSRVGGTQPTHVFVQRISVRLFLNLLFLPMVVSKSKPWPQLGVPVCQAHQPAHGLPAPEAALPAQSPSLCPRGPVRPSEISSDLPFFLLSRVCVLASLPGLAQGLSCLSVSQLCISREHMARHMVEIFREKISRIIFPLGSKEFGPTCDRYGLCPGSREVTSRPLEFPGVVAGSR